MYRSIRQNLNGQYDFTEMFKLLANTNNTTLKTKVQTIISLSSGYIPQSQSMQDFLKCNENYCMNKYCWDGQLRNLPFSADPSLTCSVMVNTNYKSLSYPVDPKYSYTGVITYTDIGNSATDSFGYYSKKLNDLVKAFNDSVTAIKTSATTIIAKFVQLNYDATDDIKDLVTAAAALPKYYTDNKQNALTYYNNAMAFVQSDFNKTKFSTDIATITTNQTDF